MAQTKYTGSNALTYIFTILKQYVTNVANNKVDKVSGKGLSTNDYTTEEKSKLGAIEAGAQVNKLESVAVNGAVQSISEKKVNLTVPTKVSDLTNDSGYQTSSDVASAISGKANSSDLTAHTTNTDVHVTTTDKSNWNAKTTMLEVEGKGYTTLATVQSQGYQTAQQVQSAIDDAIGEMTGVSFEVVEELPPTGTNGIIYLVAHNHGAGDGYDEYIWLSQNGAFEKIGSTDIDLSGYVLSSDLVELTNEEVQQIWDSVQ